MENESERKIQIKFCASSLAKTFGKKQKSPELLCPMPHAETYQVVQEYPFLRAKKKP